MNQIDEAQAGAPKLEPRACEYGHAGADQPPNRRLTTDGKELVERLGILRSQWQSRGTMPAGEMERGLTDAIVYITAQDGAREKRVACLPEGWGVSMVDGPAGDYYLTRPNAAMALVQRDDTLHQLLRVLVTKSTPQAPQEEAKCCERCGKTLIFTDMNDYSDPPTPSYVCPDAECRAIKLKAAEMMFGLDEQAQPVTMCAHDYRPWNAVKCHYCGDAHTATPQPTQEAPDYYMGDGMTAGEAAEIDAVISQLKSTQEAPTLVGAAPIGLREFSLENRWRCEAKNGFNHQLDSWSTSDWFTVILGELGEAANVAKKLNRVRDGIPGNKETADELRVKLRKEFGDVFIYLDLTAQSLGFNILDAAIEVFDAKSTEIGYDRRLSQLTVK